MSDYIKEMRKYVGHSPILVIACGVIIENEKDEILLQRRTDDDTWCIPGGSMNYGEKFVETAAREVFEETGLSVFGLSLFGIYSGILLEYPNKDVCFGALIIFHTKSYTGRLLEGDLLEQTGESKDLKFFARNNLPQNLSQTDYKYIEKWRIGNMSVVVD